MSREFFVGSVFAFFSLFAVGTAFPQVVNATNLEGYFILISYNTSVRIDNKLMD